MSDEPDAAAGSVSGAEVDVVLTASRALIALSTRSLGALAEDLSAAQYRALVVLASRGPLRLVDLAHRLEVEPSSVGRMCERLVRKGFVRRRRASGDRRIVTVSLSAQGRRVLDEATSVRRAAIRAVLAGLSEGRRRAAVDALGALSRAVGEIPDDEWPSAAESEHNGG